MIIDHLKLAQDLIRCKSITPHPDRCFEILGSLLKSLGFSLEFFNKEGVSNLYAHRKIGPGKKICFAGHVDVVPAGVAWTYPPFGGEIHGDKLYGRGAVDMKGAIASFMGALSQFLGSSTACGEIALIITSDEEGKALHGTRVVVESLKERDERFDGIIVGEPTSTTQIGDTIKIGRRGSLNITGFSQGISGHVAYPQDADNPIPEALTFLKMLSEHSWDEECSDFQPSSCQITSLATDTCTSNVIPSRVNFSANIRFNTNHSPESLEKTIRTMAEPLNRIHLDCYASALPFLTERTHFHEILSQAIHVTTGFFPILSTSGGTSDARFLKDLGPIAELGLFHSQAHHANEFVLQEDLKILEEIYKNFLMRFLN